MKHPTITQCVSCVFGELCSPHSGGACWRGEAGEGAHWLIIVYTPRFIYSGPSPLKILFFNIGCDKKNVANLQVMLILVLFLYCVKSVGSNNTYIFLEFYLYFQHIGIAKRSASLHSFFFRKSK